MLDILSIAFNCIILVICSLSIYFNIKFAEVKLLITFAHYGGLAQLARALAWQARGQRFDSAILHKASEKSEAFVFISLGGYQSGQMGQTVTLLSRDFEGSNPSPPTLKSL
jgi:hypothetical protein